MIDWLILAALLFIAIALALIAKDQFRMSQTLDNLNTAADALILAFTSAKQAQGVPEADVQAVADKLSAALNPAPVPVADPSEPAQLA